MKETILSIKYSGIYDINGNQIKSGDIVQFPYIDPSNKMEDITKNLPDFEAEIVFEHGAFGYYSPITFVPLSNWAMREKGEYIPNAGNKIILTDEYPVQIKPQ